LDKQGKENIVVGWGAVSAAGVDKFVVYHSETGDELDYVPVLGIPASGELK
jgi:hypothetical protein